MKQLKIVLGWPKASSGFFHIILQKNQNELEVNGTLFPASLFYRWNQGPEGSSELPRVLQALDSEVKTDQSFVLPHQLWLLLKDWSAVPSLAWSWISPHEGWAGVFWWRQLKEKLFMYTCSPSHVAELSLIECWRTLWGSTQRCYSCLDVAYAVPLLLSTSPPPLYIEASSQTDTVTLPPKTLSWYSWAYLCFLSVPLYLMFIMTFHIYIYICMK